MSGAEALIVLGIIANTFGVIDFTGKILGRIKDAGENVHNIPKAFRDVQSNLPLLTDALKQIQQRIESGTLGDEACAALKPTLQACHSEISELNGIFDKCLPKNGSSKFHRRLKAVISLRQDKKVQEIAELLQTRVWFLTLHHVTTPASSAVDSVTAGMTALQVKDAKRPKTYTMIPVQRAKDFTGREEQLSDLSSKLNQPGQHNLVAVVGLGGVGKTRLVRQYIEAQKNAEISVFWVHAGTAERMKSGSRDIANAVGIQGCDGPDVDILRKFKEWLESEASGRWLLIYDNVDDIDLMYDEEHGRLATYFPRSNRGSIVMTTRNRQIGIKFATAENIIPLSALTDEESITLMAARLREDNSEMRSDLEQLAKTLGGIPLAIIQAVSFIQENESYPTRYLELYEANESNQIELLSQDFEDDTRDPELKNPIASTWMVTFEYMKVRQPLAANTLCMMSMFDSQAIPEALISMTAGGDSGPSTSVEKTLGILRAYSLISPRDFTGAGACIDQIGRLFDLHRLVRLVTRIRLTMCSTYNHWMANAINVMSIRYDEADQLEEEGEWVKVKLTYLPHALGLMSSPPLLLKDDEEVFVPEVFNGQTLQNDHAENGVICPTCTGNILRRMMLNSRSVTQQLWMVKKAAAICTFSMGADHVNTLSHRFREASILNALDDTNNAEIKFRELLAGYELTFGPGERMTLEVGIKLADTLRKQEKYGEAECLLVRLQETSCQEHGQKDPLSIKIVQALCNNMITQGRDEEAHELNSEISKLVDTIHSKIELARSYTKLSQSSDAEALLLSLLEDEDALRREKCLDDVWEYLAHAFWEKGLFDKAEGFQRQALTYGQQAYGEDSLLTLLKKLDLGKTLYHLGQYHEAESLVLEVNKRSNEYPRSFRDSRLNDATWYLAKIWVKLGKYDDSRELALKAIDQTRKRQGPEHEDYLTMRRNLRQHWGINPDGTTFEGSIERETDDSSDEWETDNSSDGVVENIGRGSAEQQ